MTRLRRYLLSLLVPLWWHPYQQGYRRGHAEGFMLAAQKADRDKRLRDGLWRSGIDPDAFEEKVRARIAESER